MKIGINSGVFYRFYDEFQTIFEAAKIGYDALDYTLYMHEPPDSPLCRDGFEDYARELREFADMSGISFCQMHAPMLGYIGEVADEEPAMELTRRGFRIGQILGAPYMVIHPRHYRECIWGREKEKAMEYNLNMFRSLIPYAQEAGVKIGLENMFGNDPDTGRLCPTTFSFAEEIEEYLELLGRENFVVCLDTGHTNIVGVPPADFVRKVGPDLKLLHVHDNYVDLDQHLAPCLGTIDWEAFLQALRDVHYDGVFCYEPDGMFYNVKSKEQLLNTAEYLFKTAKILTADGSCG